MKSVRAVTVCFYFYGAQSFGLQEGISFLTREGEILEACSLDLSRAGDCLFFFSGSSIVWGGGGASLGFSVSGLGPV